jgi:hypothetical protein
MFVGILDSRLRSRCKHLQHILNSKSLRYSLLQKPFFVNFGSFPGIGLGVAGYVVGDDIVMICCTSPKKDHHHRRQQRKAEPTHWESLTRPTPLSRSLHLVLGVCDNSAHASVPAETNVRVGFEVKLGQAWRFMMAILSVHLIAEAVNLSRRNHLGCASFIFIQASCAVSAFLRTDQPRW